MASVTSPDISDTGENFDLSARNYAKTENCVWKIHSLSMILAISFCK